MERLVIHLGLHKTGTSAVQDFLTANSAGFLKRDVAYIPLDRMREEVIHLFYHTDDEKREAAKRLVYSFPTHALIMSDENIAGGIDDVAEGAFYPLARSKLTSVLEAFTALDVHLVLTLRDPVELLPALYSEYLRLFDFVSFDRYVANFDLVGISLWDTFKWIRSLSSNITTHVVPFEERFGGGVACVAATIVRAAIGTSVGFDFRTFFENKVNTSFTAEEIDLATLIAARSSGRIARLFLTNIEDGDARFGDTRFSPIETGTAELLSRRYQEDLVRFGIAARS